MGGLVDGIKGAFGGAARDKKKAPEPTPEQTKYLTRAFGDVAARHHEARTPEGRAGAVLAMKNLLASDVSDAISLKAIIDVVNEFLKLQNPRNTDLLMRKTLVAELKKRPDVEVAKTGAGGVSLSYSQP